jgi:hypothetical protein
MYLLKLFHDNLSPNSEALLQAQHSIIYVLKGPATINGKVEATDSAIYAEDFVAIKAGAEGAVLWRWELVPETDPLHLLSGDGVKSVLRMSRKVKMFELVPTSKWLFRLDCIIEFEGTTHLHSHPGSGIRCLLRGSSFRVESEKGEESVSHGPGDVWYEEGAYPLVSTIEPGLKTTFLRGMVLPPEFHEYPDTAIWIENKPAMKAGYKNYVQKVVTLR